MIKMKRSNVLTELELNEDAVTSVQFTTPEGWSVTVQARCDTGASMSSIDECLANFLSVKLLGETVKVRNAHGKSERHVCKLTFSCEAGEITSQFNITDRSALSQPVLIGRDILFLEE